MIPKPFSRVAFLSGEPLRVPSELSPETLAETLAEMSARLDRTTAEADQACGVAA